MIALGSDEHIILTAVINKSYHTLGITVVSRGM